MARLTATPNEDRPFAGIGLMLAAYLVFSCIDTSTKWLGMIGIAALQLAFMRYAGHFAIMVVLIGKGGFSRERFESEKMGLVLLRSVLLALSTAFNFIAIQYLPLTLTSTILFSAPILVCALSWPLLGERVGAWRWLAIFIGFVGILIAIRPFQDAFHPAVFLSLISASCFALYLVLTRKLSGIVAADIMQFYSGFIGALLLLPFALAYWQNPTTLLEWTLMIMLGVFGWFGHGLLIRAHGFAPANVLTPFSYSFILYLTVWSFVIFDQLPDFWTLIGASIIIAAGLIIWWRERRLRKLATINAL